MQSMGNIKIPTNNEEILLHFFKITKKLNLLIYIEAFRLGWDWEGIKDSSQATILIILL